MAGGRTTTLGMLAKDAGRLMLENAWGLAEAVSPGEPLEVRARRPWDLGAKMQIAQRIAQDEKELSNGAQNDIRDAMRHARWSKRTAEAAGPIFADVAGLAHEARNYAESVIAHKDGKHAYSPHVDHLTPGQTMDESRMDLHNNAEGRRAAVERRPIDVRRLRTLPNTPAWTALYRSPPPSRSGMPPR